ncbi:hypothetical protein KIN20_003006 [Parelaphostrongylus tenuis]|uniref:Uncharacterized protein n=1 Tax=Parelaphostrongylus tenuis TaxID=148309 RepID=A0AAD5LYI9_PARTN|nr:hypothetical protein KIN20_003006 [Parelaphostrongylus tenuis]
MVAWTAAASIIVVSRTTQRVLVMRRGATVKFMPTVVVFPDSVVANSDRLLPGSVVADSDRLFGHPTEVTALRVAPIFRFLMRTELNSWVTISDKLEVVYTTAV